MRTTVNYERLERVLEPLLSTYQANASPYNLPAATLPQDELPRGLQVGSREHAMFLFCFCYYMRGGIKSIVAADHLCRLYNRRPQLFVAELAAQQTEGSIRRSLERIGLNYMKNIVPGYWIENAKRLSEWYDGDPRNIYNDADFDEVCNRVRNQSRRGKKVGSSPAPFTKRQGFLGFQYKMASMLTYYFVDGGLIPRFDFAIPIDFHVMRIAVATEMVTFDDLPADRDVYSPDLTSTLRRVFTDYTIQYRVDPIALTNALWLLSSTLCSRHPGNRSSTIGGYKARGTEIVPHNPTWSLGERQTYDQTCGICPISCECRIDVPNAAYTRKGKLLALRPHSFPPP